MEHIEQFAAFIKELCGTQPPKIDGDGVWHRFRISDTRHRSSTPGAYLLHDDKHPVGLFMDWRKKDTVYRWTPGGETTPVDKDEVKRLAKERAEIRRAGYAEASAGALHYFQKECAAINGASHPYLDRKKIAPHGTRQGSGRPFGLGDASCVIIPIRGPDNKALTVQAIRADGARRFWKGSTTEGGYCLIGSPKTAGPVVLCEGFATGCSIHDATGFLVIVCLSASNMIRVSRWAAHQYAGREFLVAGDDDWHLPLKTPPLPNEGREAAQHAARNLGGRAAFPNMFGLVTEGGDDFNDMAVEFGLDDVETAILGKPAAPAAPEPDTSPNHDPGPAGDDIEFGPEPERPTLALLHPSAWSGQPVPVRHWRLQDLLPIGQATLFTGAGAVGKSLATQQMTSAIALGQDFLGVRTFPCPALYITCEDDADELQRRQVAICHALGVTLEATAGRVFLLSLYGEINNALCTWDDKGNLVVSDRYTIIVETCRKHGIQHVTLDNTAHFFVGNEIVRSDVAGFVNLCNRMARDIGGTVVIVGHPNKAGDSYSGSTAWENQVRSRIYMETPLSGDGVPANPDLRVMRNEKANYAQKGSEIRFMWVKGAFVHEDIALADDREKHQETVDQGRDNQLFLQLLDQLTRERRNVSHSPNSGLYAPKVMAGMTEARGVPKPRFHAAMERLLLREAIEASQPLWLGKDRHPVIGIGRTKEDKSDAK